MAIEIARGTDPDHAGRRRPMRGRRCAAEIDKYARARNGSLIGMRLSDLRDRPLTTTPIQSASPPQTEWIQPDALLREECGIDPP
jgi:hypothetical protein